MPIIETYTLGAQPRFTADFSVEGTATDPTTVTFRSITPAGVESALVFGTDAEVVKAATGSYYVDLRLTEAGIYHIRWVGTGAAAAAAEYAVRCAQSAFSTPL